MEAATKDVANPSGETADFEVHPMILDSDPPSKAGSSLTGLGWMVTGFFVVADLVGAGVVAMPVAFLDTGLVGGIIFMVVICFIYAVTGHQLGENWLIMQERWPIYRQHCRTPYPEMAIRSMGEFWRIVAYVNCYLTMFGMAVVYVLIPARTIWNFAEEFGSTIPYCYFILMLAAFILPFTYLRSPADFWWVIVIAMLLTYISVIAAYIGIGMDAPVCLQHVRQTEPTFLSILLKLGIFLFAFNGHNVFPTIQHDMREPRDFTKAIVVGFIICSLLYMPFSIFAYVVYGNSMRDSVVDSLQIRWTRFTSDISIGLHCILVLILTINPINQQFENIFHVSQSFGWHRVIIRTVIMLAVTFVAVTIPDFTPVMNVFGSTTIPISCVVLPTLFNLWLNASRYDKEKGDWTIPSTMEVVKRTPLWKLIYSIVVLVVVIIGGVIGTVEGIRNFASVNFSAPCYVRPFLSESYDVYKGSQINCCGAYRNITAHSYITDECKS
ncbi:hypothetical protein AB6A40_001739 [Gnathostoma spinigerum]|uniref:Amino acid transporter transmembrane domain-containing protein n=1 Tax=Gnathostoma spinigerum TaxID=75299 RepID=A0ABD6EFC5_9BILA